MRDDPLVDIFTESNNKKIEYLELMISDKSLLTKKHKKKKIKSTDVLAKESMKDWYRFCRDCMYYTMFNYKIAKDYMTEYYAIWFGK